MSNGSEPYDILESLHQGSVAHTKLVLAVLWRVMSDQDSKAILSLDFEQLLLKPRELVAWILALTPDEIVERVAHICVVSNDARSIGHLLSIFQLQVHAVVAILRILLCSFRSEPVAPHRCDVINGVVCVGCGKVLLIDRPRVMIAMDWHDSDIGALDGRLEHISDSFGVASDLLHRILPDIVRRVVPSPEDNIWLDLVNDEIEHVGKSLLW